MGRSEEFNQGTTPMCEECGNPLDHIHLSQYDIDLYKAISQEGHRQGQMAEHMRVAPTDVRDHAALKAHMLSDGHMAHPLDVHDASHEDLEWMHDEHHKTMDKGPADERENYTTLGNEHFHH